MGAYLLERKKEILGAEFMPILHQDSLSIKHYIDDITVLPSVLVTPTA